MKCVFHLPYLEPSITKDTRSQRNQAVLPPTASDPLDPLDLTPSVHQLSANLDRGPSLEGAAPSRRGVKRRSGEAEDEEGEESVEEEDSEETEVEAALAGAPEASAAANLAHYNQHLVSQAGPNFLKMMEKMTQFMGKLTQAVAPRDNSKTPGFKTPSIKAPYCFNDTQAHRLRGYIQSFQFIFHNDPPNFFSERKKVLYSTSFLTGKSGNRIES
ncbi:hypothetical protein O181_070086 [Austropuccinia psidii MF-1]|uniref:Uncharacterized protein n=1 Tax=Austropuccinia psidii MF-1 TaxID=1389203 RepID=A0A9Q3EY16_9BASI|nr:hypothetical protein [Austropuccinia psidii MF-1]